MQARAALGSFLILVIAAAPLVNCGTDAGVSPSDSPKPGGDAEAPPTTPRDASVDRSAPSNDEFVTEGTGTRFRTLFVERSYDDGAFFRAYTSLFWDTALDTTCWIREVGPDTWGCSPTLPDPVSGSEAFSDPDCTNGVISFAISDAHDRFIEFGESSCNPRFAKIEGATEGTVYVKTPSGSCVPRGIQQKFVPKSAEIPKSALGVFTRTKETKMLPGEKGGTRLALESERFTGEDGSFEVRPPRIVDLSLNSTGQFLAGPDGKYRLFPAVASTYSPYPSNFANAECTESIFAFESAPNCHDDPFAPRLTLIDESTPEQCSVHAYRLSSDEPLTTLFQKILDTCVAYGEPSPGRKVYSVSALTEAPSDAFAEVSRSLVAAGGDVYSGSKIEQRVTTYASADGLVTRERSPTPYIRKYDLPCEPTSLAHEATRRCAPIVPFDGSQGSTFADPECTQAVLELFGNPTCGAPTPPIYRASTADGVRYFERPTGAPLALNTVYFKDNSACRALPAYDSAIYLARGTPTEIPLTDFPKVVYERVVYGD